MGAVRAALPQLPSLPGRIEHEATTVPGPVLGSVVWVDGTSAAVARWVGYAVVDHVIDDVPSRHRSTGHVRHDPAVRHGGGGVLAEQLDRDRVRHRQAHLRRVAALVPDTGPVLLIGPGSTRLELERALATADHRFQRERSIRSEAAGRMSDRELIARLRACVGTSPARRTAGRS